jgi:hypothetical protein
MSQAAATLVTSTPGWSRTRSRAMSSNCPRLARLTSDPKLDVRGGKLHSPCRGGKLLLPTNSACSTEQTDHRRTGQLLSTQNFTKGISQFHPPSRHAQGENLTHLVCEDDSLPLVLWTFCSAAAPYINMYYSTCPSVNAVHSLYVITGSFLRSRKRLTIFCGVFRQRRLFEQIMWELPKWEAIVTS